MKYIISGTNRPQSRTLIVSKIISSLWQDLGETVEVIDLRDLGLQDVDGGQYSENQPPKIKEINQKILNATGVIMVCPEYNGSFPGALKYFVDHWKYPDAFEFRPFCLVGLGGRFGGLRGVEQMQQILGYRNAFIYPERVFLTNIWNILKDGAIQDTMLLGLLKSQASGFKKFVQALDSAQLNANAHLTRKMAAAAAEPKKN